MLFLLLFMDADIKREQTVICQHKADPFHQLPLEFPIEIQI
jgi:hypothetical protein